MATELAAAYITLIPSLRGAQNEIRQQLDSIDYSGAGKRGGEQFSSGMKGPLKAIGTFGLKAVSGLARGVAAIGRTVGGIAMSGGIARALNIEHANTIFRGLKMSAEDIESAMTSANNAVVGTAFGLDSAAVSAALLSTAGVALGQDMDTALNAIAGVATMAGSSMEDITDIFQSAAAKGKLSGDELVRLQERGVNAVAALSDYLGIAQDQVKQMVSEGEIDFQTFSNAMYAAFGDAAKGANETFTGALSNVRAALSRIGAKFATPGLDNLRKIFAALIPLINQISSMLDPLVEKFTAFANWVGDTASEAIGNIVEAWKPANMPLSMANGKKQFSALDYLVVAAQSAAATLGERFAPVLDALIERFPIVGQVIGFASERVEFLKNMFSSFIEAVSPYMQGLVSLMQEASQAFIVGFDVADSDDIGTLREFAAAFASLHGGVLAYLNLLWEMRDALAATADEIGARVGPQFVNLAEYLGDQLPSAMHMFSYIVERGNAALTTLITNLLPIIAPVLETILGAIRSLVPALESIFYFFGETAAVIIEVAGSIASVLAPAIELILPVVSRIIEVVSGLATELFDHLGPIIERIGALLSRIAGVVGSILTPVLQVLSPILQTIVSLLGAILSGIISVVSYIIGKVLDLIGGIIGFLEPVISTIGELIGGLVETVQEHVEFFMEGIQNAGEVFTGIWDFITGAISGAVSSIVGFFAELGQGASEKIQEMVDFIAGIPDEILGFFEGAGEWLKGIGESIINGLKDGIDAAWGAVTEFFGGIGEWIVEHKGPPAYDAVMLTDNGQLIMQGLADGIKEGLALVDDALQSAVEKLRTAFEGIDLSSSGSSIGQALGQGMADSLSAVGDIMGSLQSAFAQFASSVSSAFAQVRASSASMGGLSTALGALAPVLNVASRAFEQFATAAGSAMQQALERVRSACNAMAYAVSSMRLVVPRVQVEALPHFRLDGRFNAETGQVPVVRVDWYKTGGIFDAPTVIGVGEAGPEAVIPLDRLESMVSPENGGGDVNIYLTYNAGEDARQLVNDLAFWIRSGRLMEA